MDVEKQVVIIYAATKGYLDDLDVQYIGKYESDLLGEMDTLHKELLNEIAEKKDLNDETSKKLDDIISKFSERYKSTLKQ